jgi:hypothetical protein
MREVSEVCADDYMVDCLTDAMEANRDAQLWLAMIELQASRHDVRQ